MQLAPIVLFTYNRIEHTKKTLSALSNNLLAKDSDLIIFSDGPKNNLDKEKITVLRNILYNQNGFKSIKIIEREHNIGLSKNIIDGVTEICNKYGRVIVLEDDLITSPFFLTFMNEAINQYINHSNVCCINGYVYPTSTNLPETFFIKGADCWGWATWVSAWNKFEKNGAKLLFEIKQKKLIREFNFNNTFDYLNMLKDQINGKNNSWAIRWYASTFINNMYTLYPKKSLVSNIGFDNTGTHSGNTTIFNQDCYQEKIIISEIPVINNQIAYKTFESYFKKNNFYNNKLKKIIKIFLPKFIISKYKKILNC